mmetsp:Transcript_15947/g.24120  ORF Transcript_15947/g.24120 Transcript_15947/m.24120 type:complete len:147 (-) Transcript_15947:22-462(-)
MLRLRRSAAKICALAQNPASVLAVDRFVTVSIDNALISIICLVALSAAALDTNEHEWKLGKEKLHSSICNIGAYQPQPILHASTIASQLSIYFLRPTIQSTFACFASACMYSAWNPPIKRPLQESHDYISTNAQRDVRTSRLHNIM